MRSVGLPHLPFIGRGQRLSHQHRGPTGSSSSASLAPRAWAWQEPPWARSSPRLVEFCIIVGYFLLADKHVCYRIKDLFSPCREMGGGSSCASACRSCSATACWGWGRTCWPLSWAHRVPVRLGQRPSPWWCSASAPSLSRASPSPAALSSARRWGRGSVPRAQKQGNTFLILGLAIGAAAGGDHLPHQRAHGGILRRGSRDQGHRPAADGRPEPDCHLPLRPTPFWTKGVLRGRGDTRFLVAADTLTMWCFAIPLGALAGLVLHLPAF